MTLALVNISQLATCPPGRAQDEAGLVNDAAIVIEDKQVAWSGARHEMPHQYQGLPSHDCQRRLVVPGLVDCHTHLCFGGWRGDEFAMRLEGASYQQIAAAGGGIASTVQATRKASRRELYEKAHGVLDQALALGVTTMECKSGYGLEFESEIRQLEVYAELNLKHAVDLVATFLGAHIVPPEYRDRRQEYVDLLCERLIPEVARRSLARFCDVFIEDNAYSLDEARKILETAAHHGLGLKVHADQLSSGGGAELAAELGAVSAEHLEFISGSGIAALADSGTVAVSLPLASMYLGDGYLPARKLIEAGVPVAIATDFNPGSSPSFHLPMAMLQACLNQRMTPAESLTGATTIAARALGLQESAGSLTPGFPADLAIIDAPDLNHWLYHFRANACAAVMKAGQWVVR
ncbi:MAG: imidazolonepropionase [Xanthomonadales bacterium]|nr:imidazolonepropionase [Gammaproteobacteria bacterium]NNE05880.1 imidazolonepropionase [Xanthomonadales bacterium]NNL95016.1 imidazolonepropionase [Xanthomonadales bacterium]